ncbi:hypothetical protein CVT25_014236 [Psilocybe cyanescens]|uniref:Uncharacterized protein n=1 Tax=Psilocybe cyanescens TaxID=93625 RepID=A0A409XPM2_PSICY|nr:hypothetical protein CVT25_014236 [Psilocybe cyanescens]
MLTRMCTCSTSQCGLVEGGVELDICTYNNHLRKDWMFFANKLAEDSKQVLDNEIEKVGQHFASLAVSDSIPTPSSAPAVKLKKLRKIPLTNAFPLRHHHAECVCIQTNLSKVVYTAVPATAMKHQVSDKVDDIAERLEEAKLSWVRNRKTLNSRQEAETPGIKFSTDSFFNLLLACINPILQLSIFIAIVFQTLFSISRSGTSALMEMLQYQYNYHSCEPTPICLHATKRCYLTFHLIVGHLRTRSIWRLTPSFMRSAPMTNVKPRTPRSTKMGLPLLYTLPAAKRIIWADGAMNSSYVLEWLRSVQSTR